MGIVTDPKSSLHTKNNAHTITTELMGFQGLIMKANTFIQSKLSIHWTQLLVHSNRLKRFVFFQENIRSLAWVKIKLIFLRKYKKFYLGQKFVLPRFSRPTIPDKIFRTKWSNPVKLDRERKLQSLLLCVF